MTHPHPLTDDTCFGIALETESRIGYQPPSTFDYMRSAADWQLEQVIKWIRSYPRIGDACPIYDFETESDRSLLVEDLKEAMRPQEES